MKVNVKLKVKITLFHVFSCVNFFMFVPLTYILKAVVTFILSCVQDYKSIAGIHSGFFLFSEFMSQ